MLSNCDGHGQLPSGIMRSPSGPTPRRAKILVSREKPLPKFDARVDDYRQRLRM
jgi:hypothetical protein